MTPDQYLATLEHLGLSNQFQAVLDFANAHRAIVLTHSQSIQAETVITHAVVQLDLEAFFGSDQSSKTATTPPGLLDEMMNALAGEARRDSDDILLSASEPMVSDTPAREERRRKQAG